MMAETPHYLIWSFEHGAWWAPARQGYTENLDLAGRYTAHEAGQIVTDSVWLDEVAILEQVVTHWGNKPPKYHPYHGAAENDDA